MNRRIGLVGCVKQKQGVAAPAEDLYTSTLFIGRRRFVERSCDEWWILSAAHGLVNPEAVLAPYDVTLKNASRAERRQWTSEVLTAIDREVRLQAGDVVELHAGSEYCDFGLVEGLVARGARVEMPTEGLGIGKQLRFYKQQNDVA